ncbi:MAG: zf-TFIIB domain-containing protein [Thermoplasmata archaeon]
MSITKLSCPRCSFELKMMDIEGTPLWLCSECGNMMLDTNTLQTIAGVSIAPTRGDEADDRETMGDEEKLYALEKGEKEKESEREKVQPADKNIQKNEPENRCSSSLSCPGCHKNMTHVSISGVCIDSCPHCSMVIASRDALETIIANISPPAPLPPPPFYPPSPSLSYNPPPSISSPESPPGGAAGYASVDMPPPECFAEKGEEAERPIPVMSEASVVSSPPPDISLEMPLSSLPPPPPPPSYILPAEPLEPPLNPPPPNPSDFVNPAGFLFQIDKQRNILNVMSSSTVVPNMVVESVFILYKNGILISSFTSDSVKPVDRDILGGMITAITDFVRTSFIGFESSCLECIRFKGRELSFETGEYLTIAIVLKGGLDEDTRRKIHETLIEIETSGRDMLERWNGDRTGIKDVINRFSDLIVPVCT